MVYSRKIEGKLYTFGVSGRLYKSNVLLYDHQTESLWSQLLEKAISGPLAGKSLHKLPSSGVSWKVWEKRNPDTLVLSTQTGYFRDYTKDPYEGYYRVGTIWFPAGDVRTDLKPKEIVLGIEIEGETKAYPLSLLRRNREVLKDRVGGNLLEIEVSEDGEVIAVRNSHRNPISSVSSYWFAWQAFHPKTLLYQGKNIKGMADPISTKIPERE